MKTTRFLIAAMAAAVLTSCTKEQHDFFPDSSANRADATIATHLQVLTGATHGWLMQYYPDSQQSYGGYNLITRYRQDGQVDVMGEIYGDTLFTSHYTLHQSAGIVLTFDTYNPQFHAFSDPSAPLGGYSGTGWDGDYDFSILKATPDSVVLKGKKTGNHIIMTPMADSNWADYLETISRVASAMQSETYSLRIGSDELIAESFARTLFINYEDDGEHHEITLPYIITPQGMQFYQPVTLKGQTFNGFRYQEGAHTFPATDNAHVTLVK